MDGIQNQIIDKTKLFMLQDLTCCDFVLYNLDDVFSIESFGAGVYIWETDTQNIQE